MNYEITTKTPDGLWRYSLETPTGLVTGAIAADSKGQAKRKIMQMQKQVLKRAGGGTTPLNKKQARKLAKEIAA